MPGACEAPGAREMPGAREAAEKNLLIIFFSARTAEGSVNSFHGSGKFLLRAIRYWSLGGSNGIA